jgi:hypothetical protein
MTPGASIVPDANSPPDNLDSVLRKYGKIWIWSILSSAVAALSVRSLSSATIQYGTLNNSGRGQMAAQLFFLTLSYLVPAVATAASVWYLFEFLRHHILPILFPPPPPTEMPAEVYSEPADPPDGAALLTRAFACVLIAMAVEVAIALASVIYRTAN